MYAKVFKRLLDFVLSVTALLVLSPILLILTFVGAVAMKGNPFFLQPRPGKKNNDGKEQIFKLIKFRTMSNAKDKNGNLSNVVLLNNVGFGTIDVYGGYTLYGNGFTMTASADSVAKQMDYGFVVLENGTLDNVQIVCPNFSHSILYDSNKSEGGNTSDGQGRYNNIRSAVVMKGDSTITNSYVSGGRAAVYVCSGIATINNSTVVGGAAANIDIAVVNSVLLKDLTLIQKPFQATVNNLNKTLMGMSVIVHCDSDGSTADIRLEGNLKQYAWIDEDDAQYVPSVATGIVNTALAKTDFLHDLNGDKENESLNLGFVFMLSLFFIIFYCAFLIITVPEPPGDA